MSYAASHRPALHPLVPLVRELQGSETQTQFAARIGLHQSELSRFLRRELSPTRRIIVGLLQAYPERRDQIIEALTEGEAAQAAS